MGEKKDGEKKKNNGEDGGGGDVTTVVMKLDLHCEGCAKKVRRSIKNFDGVESVKTESSSGKITVTGKVDPAKIKERLEEKTKKKVELISPQPNKPSNGGSEKNANEKKSQEKKSEGKSDENKSQDKKEKPKQPQVSTVSLKTRVHCDGCASKIKKIIGKCEGVQDVNVDLQKDLITMKGTMNTKELLPYLNIKLKRVVELAPTKKDEGSGVDKKPKEGGGGGSSEKQGDGEKKDKSSAGSGGDTSTSKENATKIEVNKFEYNPYGHGYGYAYTYDPNHQGEGYGHQVVEYWHAPEYTPPPQMFSDENPNACSIM